MKLHELLYSLFWMILSIIAYKYHKWWVNKMKKKYGKLDIYEKSEGTIKSWGLIIISGLLAIMYFWEALKMN